MITTEPALGPANGRTRMAGARAGAGVAAFVAQNRRAWNHLARMGSSASEPWDMPGTPQELRSWVDELGWLPWPRIRDVLVLCGAGGQQAPTYARLGLNVTVADLSRAQLAIDRRVAARFGVTLETVTTDVHDLSALSGRRFDLVHQPASTCYLADPRICYANVARLLAPGGLYLSEHWNPAQIQLGAVDRWDGGGYRVIHRSGSGEPLRITHPSLGEGPECLYFAHRMSDLVGGICDAGFVIERFGERGEVDPDAEPDSPGHVGAYLPSFLQVLARRTDDAGGGKQPRREPPARSRPQRPANGAGRPQVRPPGRAGPPRTAMVRVPDRAAASAARFQAKGFAVVRDVLDTERLVPNLTRESLAQRESEYVTNSEHYGLGHDRTYIAGGMSFTSSVPGPELTRLHHSPGLQQLIRAVTGNPLLRHSGNLSYMYYYPGSFIDVHTDVPSCTVTVLTTIIGRTPPLVAYPRLHGLRPRQLLAVARRTGGRPPGGVALELPYGGLLVIDGRRLPHRRPLVRPGQGPYGIAALCFVEQRLR